MDETTYSEPTIIEQINTDFIPVRVDNDQRPDVNLRYNMGGWPTTVLLTGEGEVLYGGTYIPSASMHQVLNQIHAFYSQPENRLEIVKKVQEVKAARLARARTPAGGALDPNAASKVVHMLASAFDEEYGGFGTDQKFPHVSGLSFLLDYRSRHHDKQAQTIVVRSLHAMADGGMYDHIQGGFFRYSTTPDFSVPHFEKMLEDLGGLLLVCARAAAMFADARLASVAIDVKRYLDQHLWIEARSGYGGSQDADEHYYSLDAEGRVDLPEPYVDPTIYTSWNAQAARALLLAAPLLGSSRVDIASWTARGLTILESLWSRLLSEGLMCRWFDGTAHVRGLLGDQVWAAWGALAAFAASGEVRWLARCRGLIESSDALYDTGAEGYVDRFPSGDDPGRTAEHIVPFEDNANMARVLLEFADQSGESKYAERAQAMLRRFARDYQAQGLFASSYASAVLDLAEPPIDVHVVGCHGDPTATALRDRALAVASPPVRVGTIDPAEQPRRAADFGASQVAATAYLCRGTTCFAKVDSAGELASALANSLATSPLS